MWRVIGLMLAALFVGTNANLVLPCPVISHKDEVYYMASDEKSVSVTLTGWETISGEVDLLKCGPYTVGKELEVGLGECDIECEACNAGGVCCPYKYLLTVKVAECPVITHENEVYYLIDKKPYKEVQLTKWTETTGKVESLKCGAYTEGKKLKVTPGECDIECEACGEGGACCPYKYLLTVVERSCSEENIENGQMTSPSVLIGSEATVTCNDGFASVGNKGPITCKSKVDFKDADGSPEELGKNSCYWENMPECQEITCAKPGAGIKTKAVSGGPRKLNKVYTYSCKRGYTAIPDKLNTVCEVNGDASTGKWSVDPPTCEDIDECTSGDDDCDTNAQCDNTDGGYDCKCNDGYNGDGKSCDAITCAKPEEGIKTVAVSGGRRDREAVFTYSCEPDHTLLSGDLTTVCTVDVGASTGHWSNEAPTCEAPEKSSTAGPPLKCPRGFGDPFEEKYCLTIIEDPDIWEVQAQKCKAKNGQLAIPRSTDKVEVLQRYQLAANPVPMWYGAQALVVSNVFTDFDLNRLSFTYFKNGKPEKASGKGLGPDCVSVSAQNGKWTNECCYTRHPAICEAEPLGVPDCDDVSGYVFFQDRCLRFITNEDSFEAQCNECRRLKGHLAPSLNDAQNGALLAFYKSESTANGKPAWFNLHNLISSSNYQTTELLTSTFSKLPGKSSDSARCVNIGSGGWGKECCHEKLPAICELNQCPKHYIQMGDTCVRQLQTPDTWEASEKKCRKDGASLLVFGGGSTRSQLLGLLGKDSTFVSEGSWIGCHDQVEEKKIQTPFLKDIGFSSQVSGNNAERDCCLLNSDGIAMGCCYERLRAVCSLPLEK